jgi:hypothetical protein
MGIGRDAAGNEIYTNGSGITAQDAQALITTATSGLATQTALATKADASAVPNPANSAPMAEKTGAAIGQATTRYALEDHQHPRATSTTVGSVTTGNTAYVPFSRTFTNEPGINYSELPATSNTTTPDSADTAVNAQPTTHKVIAWSKDANGLFTGCTIRVFRAQTIPTNLVSLLLGGVFNLFGSSVIGTRFSLIAVARSDVAA